MARRPEQSTLPATTHDQTVRFYFDVAISCLIPEYPHRRRGKSSDAAWEARYMEGVQEDVSAAIDMEGLSIAHRKHEVVDAAYRLHTAHFTVSVTQKFTAAECFIPREGYVGFSIKPKQFLKAKAALEAKIRNALKEKWIVHTVSYDYAASWIFVYEVKIAGTVELRRIFSQEEIDDADGSVRQAIENFNYEVVSNLEYPGFTVIPQISMRRPKDNIYKFDVYRTEYCGVTEDAVSGDIARLKKENNTSSVHYLELKSARDSFGGHVEDAEMLLELQDLPEGTQLVRAALDLVDYDEDIYDCGNDLVY
ncbi:hypothetical protein LMG28688_05215 [Paraburkholderia caffeinitolerans]|uniref:Uncharacterized protein n=2 Tax=Paraburkholderia caffeinitolerans TaxID=1723730 RepID=A0A6J5GH23_9BURK|nr:hypothetical protein LMG28688_05215 [Paraburkholderia caffeinitolerans]